MRNRHRQGLFRCVLIGVTVAVTSIGFAADTPATTVTVDLTSVATDSLYESDGSLSWRKLVPIEKVMHDSDRDGKSELYARLFANPIFSPEVRSLAGKRVKIRGYALVRWQEGGLHSLMISSMPPLDADGCPSGGMETQVVASFKDVVTIPIGQIVTVEGVFYHRETGQRIGVYYRLLDAKVVASS